MRKRHILTKAEAAEMSELSVRAIEQLEATMHEIIDELVLNQSMTSAQIAENADLHPSTVDRMVNYETKRPQYPTVAKLAFAAGWTLALNKHRIALIRKPQPKRRAKLRVA